MERPSYTIAVVGPSDEFVKRVGINLQGVKPGYDVVGYDDTSMFLKSIDRYPMRIPLLVIADFAARSPDVKNGVFVKAHEKIPRLRGIYFSTQPTNEHCRQMLNFGVLGGVVVKESENDMQQLGDTVKRLIRDFESSTDYWLLNRLSEDAGKVSISENSIVETSQGEFRFSDLLVEIARKTATGELASVDMLRPYAHLRSITWHETFFKLLRPLSKPLCFVSVFGGLTIFLVSCILGFLDTAVLGLGALLIGLVHLAEEKG